MSDATYQVILAERAQRGLKRLDRVIAQQVLKKIQEIASNVEGTKHLALKGRWRGFYKARSGDYRIIYGLDHARKRFNVVLIGHRSSVYDE